MSDILEVCDRVVSWPRLNSKDRGRAAQMACENVAGVRGLRYARIE